MITSLARQSFFTLLMISTLSGCGQSIQGSQSNEDLVQTSQIETPDSEINDLDSDPSEVQTPLIYPKFDWQGAHPAWNLWNQITYDAILEEGTSLTNKPPSDIETFCPNYESLESNEQHFFWIALISAMSRFESSFNPDTQYKENFKDSTGQYVVSRGLLQLSFESALAYGCPLQSAIDLHDPMDNLNCTVKILNRWIDRDKVITAKRSGSWKGGARYWSVLRKADTLQSIQEKTRNLAFCKE